MRAVADLAPHVGIKAACRAFGLNRGLVYRDRAQHRTIGAEACTACTAKAAVGALERRAAGAA